MQVDYITHSGDDLMVVNAARVSFDKASEWELTHLTDPVHGGKIPPYHVLSDRDTKLIKYLASHGHWTPFAHPQITLRMTAPVFVRTQCFKHKVGFVENEVSRRYVDDEPEFFVPDAWRKRADNKKQGSSDETINPLIEWWSDGPDLTKEMQLNDVYEFYLRDAVCLYLQMIEKGVAPEQARMILPQSMYTQWYWTGSLAAYARFVKQRTDDHAQKEIQDLAKMVGDIIQPLFPVSWKALTDV